MPATAATAGSRGLVTLSELRAVGAAAGFVQLALVLWLDTALVPLLLAVWAYLALMTKEFFARVWLRAHPIAYLGTHMLNIPLITVFATAFDWRVAREPLPPGLLWMPATTFFVCLGLEIGRKIRAAADEEHGVETYSLLWGRNRAAAAWTAALLAAAACGLGAAGRIGGVGPIAIVATVLASMAMSVAMRFVRNPAPGRGRSFERFSEMFAMVLLGFLGPVQTAAVLLRS